MGKMTGRGGEGKRGIIRMEKEKAQGEGKMRLEEEKERVPIEGSPV